MDKPFCLKAPAATDYFRWGLPTALLYAFCCIHSIMVAPAPHLNGHYTIFGEAVDGFEVRAGSASTTVVHGVLA